MWQPTDGIPAPGSWQDFGGSDSRSGQGGGGGVNINFIVNDLSGAGSAANAIQDLQNFIRSDGVKNLMICIGNHQMIDSLVASPSLGPSVSSNVTANMTQPTARSTGFPTGYFRIRAAGTEHYWTPRWWETHQDGNSIALWTLNTGSEQQVFFVNPQGNLCCGSHGAHVDVTGNALIIAHDRPLSTFPWPNPWSHPLPTFSYSEETKMITVKSYAEPPIPGQSPRPETEWKDKEFVLAARSVAAIQTPGFDEFARWAPNATRAKSRWTTRAGTRVEANTTYNLGIEEKAENVGPRI